jgi:hypothetical protein
MPLRLLLCVAAVVLGLVSGALSVSASSPYNPFEPIYPTISSDGKQLAWVEGSTWRVWVGSPDGSGAHVFGPSFANGIGQIAWTRLGIVVDSNYTLFLLTADGKRKKIASVADQEFSTGGNRVAVGGGQGGGPLTVVDLGTRKTTRFGAGTPALSPDGRRVGWASTSGVWVATSSGAHAHRIAVAGGCLAWSPNSRSLAYLTSKGNGNQLDLAVTSAAGGTTARSRSSSPAATSPGRQTARPSRSPRRGWSSSASAMAASGVRRRVSDGTRAASPGRMTVRRCTWRPGRSPTRRPATTAHRSGGSTPARSPPPRLPAAVRKRRLSETASTACARVHERRPRPNKRCRYPTVRSRAACLGQCGMTSETVSVTRSDRCLGGVG